MKQNNLICYLCKNAVLLVLGFDNVQFYMLVKEHLNTSRRLLQSLECNI